MESKPEPTRYHYQALDRLLSNDHDPQEVGNTLDEIMHELVTYANQVEDYREKQESHYYMLRILRDIFWKLEKLD